MSWDNVFNNFGAGGANLAKIVPRRTFSYILELGSKPSPNSSQDTVFDHFWSGGGKPSQNTSQGTVFVHFGAGGASLAKIAPCLELGPKPSQNNSQHTVFDHFGIGGASLAKIDPRRPFSCILELGMQT